MQVGVENQFGTQELIVWGPGALAVPTQKLKPQYHQPPVGLDYFLLYKVIGGLSVNVTVGLNDQFSYNPEVLVLHPAFFANPVQKTHDGEVTEVVNREAYLVFYVIECPSFEKRVQVVNQLGDQTLDVYGPYLLAVPSKKLYYEPIS